MGSSSGRVAAAAAFLVLLAAARANSMLGNMTDSAVSVSNETLTNEANGKEITEALKTASDMVLHLRAGRKPRDDDEKGSGLPLDDLLVVTSAPEETHQSTVETRIPEISQESAENDHLLTHEDMAKEDLRPHVPTESPWHVSNTIIETTVVDLDPQEQETQKTQSPAVPPTQPVTVDFDLGSRRELITPSPSAHELQGRDPTSWSMLDTYDYATPYNEATSPTSDDYSTTTDMYEEPTTTTTTTPPRTSRPRFLSPVFPAEEEESRVGISRGTECRLGYVRANGTCRSQCDTQPNYCLNGGQCYVLDGIGVFCRCNIQDYVWHKGARCESVITEFQVMCIAIGASALTVLLLFMIIVCFAKKLHVLKTENNKLRKRSKYRPSSEQHNDNFSLSTIAEGSHPNVRKLCDTPPVLPHARALAYYDNIICQDDPNAQNKLEDPVKAPPPKEDESLNIQNSLTPKHENHKMLGEENSSEVNSLQNNMM
ncbi:chondroitin sulfate proteoglycan 5 isoform X2 [Hoplias malabaricus]|uniref:chondroitin sulfate proteoglycan 5 isoform X2 n=1 Tax=Hoplias malabaricus TaxID=27720 RepID=UPI003462A078